MAKKKRTPRKLSWKEALVVIALAMILSLIRQATMPSYDMSNIPDYDGTSAYAVIDRNQPSFTEEDYTTESYEYYSDLDSLGRCGVTEACIGVDLMPTEERERSSSVYPPGWVQHQYMNVDGMLPFENEVADYVASTGNHVLYRVTPAFVGSELVARGVEMEAYSIEDDGRGVCFHVYCYNVQPGVEIDYATGENWAA